MPTIFAGNVLGTLYAGSNSTQATSAGYSANSLHFHGAGIASVGVSGGSVLISVPSGGGAGDGYNILAAGGSTAGTAATVGFIDSGGVSFGFTNGTQISATVKTDYQTSGAYLTTAMLSDESHIRQIIYGTATQNSGTIVLSGSAGISVLASAGSAIISFDGHHLDALIPSGNGYGTGFSSMTSGTVGLSAGQGVSFSQNANVLGIQVATNYLLTARASNDAIGLNSALTANGVSMSANSSGLSLNFPAFLVTARASNDAIGLNSALTANGVSATANSSGLSLNFPAFLTTAAQVSHSHGDPTLALTNLSGTTASASNGFTLSLAAPAPGAAAADKVYYCVPPWAGVNNALITNLSNINNIPFFMPFYCDGALTGDEFHWMMSRATAGSNSFTVDIGFYSIVNSSSLSLASSVRAQYVATDTASISGIRLFEAPLGAAMSTLSQGAWVLGIVFSATATVRGNYSLMGNATVSGPNSNVIQAGSNSYAGQTAHQMMPFFGRYTATSAALPGNVRHAAGASDIIGAFSGASMPIPMNWTIGNHYA
jgi:hypothetical protein